MRSVGLILLAAASIAFASEASAQRATTWTGFYVGPNLGYSLGRSSTTLSFVDGGGGGTVFSTGNSFDMNGPVGGGQFGYNWLIGRWLVGWETDFQFSGQSGRTSTVCAGGLPPDALVNGTCGPGHVGDTVNDPALPITTTLRHDLNWFGTVRGRFGAMITPNLVVFSTGGLAYGRIDTSSSVTGTNIFGTPGADGAVFVPIAVSFQDAATNLGWVVGLGLEGQLAGNSTIKIEYLHVDLGDVSGSFTTPLIGNSGALLVSSYRSRITDDILRIGMNFKVGPIP